jgi:hypothetical protein
MNTPLFLASKRNKVAEIQEWLERDQLWEGNNKN